ncbi:hypothetical protein [Rhizobacter sp. Root1221]|uniref:hypothetical protein n=1 Tax=Rhizobacter sp. Root1221 TaxID=1736433 RepID=UPI000A6EAE84|nr:hypothetical protein [Rhizobacter sp. Root1221]
MTAAARLRRSPQHPPRFRWWVAALLAALWVFTQTSVRLHEFSHDRSPATHGAGTDHPDGDAACALCAGLAQVTAVAPQPAFTAALATHLAFHQVAQAFSPGRLADQPAPRGQGPPDSA